MMIMYGFLLVVGFAALIKGADWFVDGSSALARNFRVPGVIIGLTIVALGTSAPELAVSTSAALQGANEIALSNVVGSNIFNLLCVLGVCAVIRTVPVEEGILKRDFPLSVIVTALVLLMTCSASILSGSFLQGKMEDRAGIVNRVTGIVLLAVFIAYIILLIYDAKKHPDTEETGEMIPLWRCFLLIAVGLILIIAGGQAVVYSAKVIAGALGMTETLIGLSIVAARKGEAGLAVGNVVGSNIFNLLFILGISSAIHPIAVNVASVFDMMILLVVSILTWAFSVRGKSIRRTEGVLMVFFYITDMVFAVLR